MQTQRTHIHYKTHEKVAQLALKLVCHEESLAETLDVAGSLLRDAAAFEMQLHEGWTGDPVMDRCFTRAQRMTAIANEITAFLADLDDGIA